MRAAVANTTDLDRRVVLHLAAPPIGNRERLARPRVPYLHDARLVAARQVVSIVPPLESVHLVLVRLDPPDPDRGA